MKRDRKRLANVFLICLAALCILAAIIWPQYSVAIGAGLFFGMLFSWAILTLVARLRGGK